MIVDERMVTYIRSLEVPESAVIEAIEQEALRDRVPIIRKEMQSFLKVLLMIKRPMRILEVGAAVGFSSILMSEYMPEGGHITTIENYDKRIPIARANFKRAGKEEQIDLIEGDALEVMHGLEGPYDLIFVDAAKGQYIHFLPEILRLLAKDGVLVVLDKTPFYAEMGGQVADNGLLTGPECSLRVLDVKKTPKGYYVHTCVLESGIVKVGDHLNAQVDKEYRMSVCRNHTATHLLQAALREVLGDHVHQAGSYQDAEITHFDFTHFSAVTPEELARVEKIVNDRIFDAMNVEVKEMPIEEAKKLGAMALFGEKYGKVVRVVNIEGWSTEFCGGTHVKNTAQIGCFKIVSESSVAAGIRRIEAVTGKNLLVRANLQEAMLHTVANTLKANNITSLPIRAEAVMAENKAMSRELEEIKAKVAASKVSSLFDNAEEVGGVKIASAYFTGTSGDTLRGMCDSIRDKAVNPCVAVLVSKTDDKVTMAVTVNKLAQEKGLKAGVLVKEISAIAGGKGGGKPDFAMAGLKDETKIDEALAAVKGIVEKQLG